MFLNLNPRPDLCYSVNALSRYSQKPTVTHWKLLKRIIRYIKKQRLWGLSFRPLKPKQESFQLELQTDASWGDTANKRSTYGYVVFINSTPVQFRTKVHGVVALSTTESEFISSIEGMKEAMYIFNLLRFLEVQVELPMRLLNDNTGSLSILKGTGNVRKTPTWK